MLLHRIVCVMWLNILSVTSFTQILLQNIWIWIKNWFIWIELTIKLSWASWHFMISHQQTLFLGGTNINRRMTSETQCYDIWSCMKRKFDPWLMLSRLLNDLVKEMNTKYYSNIMRNHKISSSDFKWHFYFYLHAITVYTRLLLHKM